MKLDRRSFFATLLAPLVARFIPRNTLLDTVNDGPNPEWDGLIREPLQHSTVHSDGVLDEINAVTMHYLNENPLLDNIFARSPLHGLLYRHEQILNASGQIIGPYGRMPGEPWFRLSAGLQQSGRAPRLPA